MILSTKQIKSKHPIMDSHLSKDYKRVDNESALLRGSVAPLALVGWLLVFAIMINGMVPVQAPETTVVTSVLL
jgi:hypothetical protein